MSPVSERDDRIFLATRIVAAAVVFILVLAVLALYLNPDQTDQDFAWTIKPRMTAMMMGAGYLMGAYFFVRVLTGKYFHRAAGGFLPITAFTIFMALATFLHFDKFHPGDWHAYLWSIVYVITPLLVPFIRIWNGRTDSGAPEPNDVVVPLAWRRLALAGGSAITLLGVVFFLFPDLAIRLWPWMLTPLTARVLAGWLMLPGIGGVNLLRETRWSAWRLLFESIFVGSLFFGIAMIASWSDFSPSNPLTDLIALVVVGAVLLAPATYIVVELRRQRMAATAA